MSTTSNVTRPVVCVSAAAGMGKHCRLVGKDVQYFVNVFLIHTFTQIVQMFTIITMYVTSICELEKGHNRCLLPLLFWETSSEIKRRDYFSVAVTYLSISCFTLLTCEQTREYESYINRGSHLSCLSLKHKYSDLFSLLSTGLLTYCLGLWTQQSLCLIDPVQPTPLTSLPWGISYPSPQGFDASTSRCLCVSEHKSATISHHSPCDSAEDPTELWPTPNSLSQTSRGRKNIHSQQREQSINHQSWSWIHFISVAVAWRL